MIKRALEVSNLLANISRFGHKYCAQEPRGKATLAYVLRGDGKIPAFIEFQAANAFPDHANKKQIVTFWKLNELAFEDSIFSTNAM